MSVPPRLKVLPPPLLSQQICQAYYLNGTYGFNVQMLAFNCFKDNSTVHLGTVVFVCSQFTALFFSIVLRCFFKPTKYSPTVRYTLQLCVGLSIALLSFGWGTLHFLIDATICYILTLTLDPRYCPLVVTLVSVAYMSAIHLCFQFSNFGVNNLDYVGPLMILTEKLSSLSWSIHDGFTKPERDLNELQKKMVVRQYPSVLKFYSFIFCPQNLLVGPCTFYTDYCKFIEGDLFKVTVKHGSGEEKQVYKEPSATNAVIGKLLFTGLSALCMLTLVPRFPIMGNVDDDWIANHSFLYRLGWLVISIEVAKSKYFMAWVWADAINNCAGLGFNGYDDTGKPKWDGITNVKIWKFQTATSLKVLIDNWNITGARWLRHVCFDRVPVQKKLATFMLSSIWHGFYPDISSHLDLLVSWCQQVRKFG
ncbi:putative lysophospholipid acyltransferase 2 [Apostichopus japonicus]|uniref:Putative lysophospholipid acyltransferase 2 n=1 Tax=Stichopus japonicus TaxID=307972 RepID=A0A2G8L0P6_STIJA|nr:putative lysophospholipid acyltransferase 2 [Apostichopus japonicus]